MHATTSSAGLEPLHTMRIVVCVHVCVCVAVAQRTLCTEKQQDRMHERVLPPRPLLVPYYARHLNATTRNKVLEGLKRSELFVFDASRFRVWKLSIFQFVEKSFYERLLSLRYTLYVDCLMDCFYDHRKNGWQVSTSLGDSLNKIKIAVYVSMMHMGCLFSISEIICIHVSVCVFVCV